MDMAVIWKNKISEFVCDAFKVQKIVMGLNGSISETAVQ